MARNLNLKVKVDDSKANTALRGFQRSLIASQKELDKFNSKIRASNANFEKLNSTTQRTEGNLKSVGDASEKAGKDIDLMGKYSEESKKALDKLNRTSVKSSKVMRKAFGNIMGGVKKDIIAATKLLTAFGAVTGGIALHKAKNDYLNYSKNFSQFRAVVKPQNEEQVTMLKQVITNASNAAGVDPAVLAKEATTLASGGIEIDVNNFKKSSKEFEKIITIMGRFAKISGSTFEESSNAIVRLGNSFGFTRKEMGQAKTTEFLTGVLATTLDAGLGSLSEYSTQLNKFVKQGIESGMSKGEVMALFARQTKNMTVFMSGFAMKAAMAQIGNGLKESRALTTKISNLLKPSGKDAYGIKKEFKLPTEELTKKYVDFLAPLTKPGAAMQKFYYNKDGQALTGTERLEKMVQFLAEGKDAGLNPAELAGLVTTNENAAKILLDLYKGGLKDFKAIVAKFGDFSKMTREQKIEAGVLGMKKGEKNAEGLTRADLVTRWATRKAMIEREEALVASTSQAYDEMQAAYTNMTNATIDKMSPSINATLRAMADVFSGKETNIEAMNKIFEDNYNKLKGTSPLLADMVKMMQKFANYAAKGELKKDFETALEAMKSIGKLSKTVFEMMSGISDFFGGGITGAIAAIAGLSILKNSLKGLAGTIGSTISQSIGLTKLGVGFGAKMARGFGAVAIGTTIGYVVAGIIKKHGKEENDKQYAGIDKFRNSLNKVKKPLKYMNSDELQHAAKNIYSMGNQTIKITGWSNAQQKLIYDAFNGDNKKISKFTTALEDGTLKINTFLKSLGRERVKKFYAAEERDYYSKEGQNAGEIDKFMGRFLTNSGIENHVGDRSYMVHLMEYIGKIDELNTMRQQLLSENKKGISENKANIIVGDEQNLSKQKKGDEIIKETIVGNDVKTAAATEKQTKELSGKLDSVVNAIGNIKVNPIVKIPIVNNVGPTGTPIN